MITLVFLANFLSTAQSPSETPKCTLRDYLDYKIVADPVVARPGEIVHLEILAPDEEKVSGHFNWSVSIGTIVSGQGTTKITISTPKNALEQNPEPPPNKHSPYIATFNWRRSVPFQVAAKPVSSNEPSACEKIVSTFRIGNSTMLRNIPAKVLDLVLDHTEIVEHCNTSPQEGATKSSIVDVLTNAFDAENDVLTYAYTVNGGRIVGTGAKVKWDLTGVKPGKYDIVAGADDGCGVCGKTIKKSVTVIGCPNK
ncbi:MAG: hypothetical protein QM785_19340 [Pyrinomonadaceae bacterium]